MKTLTLELAKELKGKTIKTHYNGYAGQDGDNVFVVGDIKSTYELALLQPIDNYPNRAAYWESYMSNERLTELKSRLELLDINGGETFIRCHQNSGFFTEPTFTCSDADREVTFEVI